MGRISASNARGMYNAYSSVYEGYGKKKEGGCVDKEDKGKHNCAKKVCHEQFGEGTCIFGEHAVPDENGFVSHYDVLFNHGVEKDVPVSEMEVLEEGSHNEDYHRYEGEQLDEGDLEQLQELGIGPVRERIPMSSGRLTIPGAKREAEQRRKDEAASKAQAAKLGDDAARETGVPRGKIPPGATLTQKPAISNIPPAEGMVNNPDYGKKPAPAKSAPAPAKPAAPKSSSVVLARKGGVMGKLDKATGKWTKGDWSEKESARYNKVSTAKGNSTAPAAVGVSPSSAKPAPANNTSAAKPETAVAIPRPTGATQGPAGAKIDPNSVRAALARENTPNILGNTKSAMDAERIKARAATIANKKTPAPRVMSARERMLNQDLNLFDVVKGHLMSEGYADTEEAALAIMANMSEEWRKSIIEEVDSQGNRSHDLFTDKPNPNYKPGKPKPSVKKEPPKRDEPLW